MGKFVIKRRKNGEYQFNLKATNGQDILASEGYTTLAACKNGIESVMKNAADEKHFERRDNCFTISCWFLPNINMNQP